MTVGSSVKRIVEFHIGIQRVVLRTDGLLGVGIVQRCRHLGLLREQLTQLQIGGYRVRHLVVGISLHDGLFQSAKALSDITSCHVHATEVRQLHVHGTVGSPTALIAGILQSQLIDPHLTRLHATGEVAHTDNHRLHLTQRRVTDD